jgi:hypothetical protein
MSLVSQDIRSTPTDLAFVPEVVVQSSRVLELCLPKSVSPNCLVP